MEGNQMNKEKTNNNNKAKDTLNKEEKKLPLSSDIVFKKVFAKEENKDLLISLLESILDVKIENLEVQNPEIPKDMAYNKSIVLDIKAKINNSIICDIEIQVKNENNIHDRSLSYMVRLASNELKVGQDYKKLSKTIVINILNFEYFKRNSYHNIAHMKFEKTTKEAYVNLGYKKEDEVVSENLEMHFIELPKFKKKNPNIENKLNQWLWLISGEEEKIKMARYENEEVKKAIEVIDEMSMDPKEWAAYDSRLRGIWDYYAGMKSAEDRGIEKRNKETEKPSGIKERKKEKTNRNSKKIDRFRYRDRKNC